MTGVDVQELTLADQQMMFSHDRVKQHFAAGIDHFDEELGPGKILEKPELLAAFVNAAAMETLAAALENAKASRLTSIG